MLVTPLSEKHRAELELAVERALGQWAKGVEAPADIVAALERVLLFLKQNAVGASAQARQVASLGFCFGQQLVRAGWTWESISDDGGVNPAVVAPDRSRACLVVDVMTLLVMGEAKGSLGGLYRACVGLQAHPLVLELAT